MDPNQSDEERNNFSEVDDETDMWFMMQACEYKQRLKEEQNQPRLTRNPIHRDREDAERRLMTDYFDDYSIVIQSLRAPKHFFTPLPASLLLPVAEKRNAAELKSSVNRYKRNR
ncbi:hypothetical protein Tco_1369445 [Tanacetum coccineum]